MAIRIGFDNCHHGPVFRVFAYQRQIINQTVQIDFDPCSSHLFEGIQAVGFFGYVSAHLTVVAKKGAAEEFEIFDFNIFADLLQGIQKLLETLELTISGKGTDTDFVA